MGGGWGRGKTLSLVAFCVPVRRFATCAAPMLPCAAVWSRFGVVSPPSRTARALFCGSWAASESPSLPSLAQQNKPSPACARR